MKLCVIGLGYIGLPTAVMFAKHGVQVHGMDTNLEVVKKLSSGRIHIEEPGLQELLNNVLEAGMLNFGVTPEEADAFIIAVPTPINPNKTANLDYVQKAIRSVVPYIRKGNLIILESTVPPRTIEDIVLPILEETKLNVKSDLFVSHSPERVLPGKLLEELVWNDRIVGGINTASAEKTAELYGCFVKGKIHLTDSTTAEMVKLMENTYRDVNIAFANEMAKIAENVGFNVWEAIELANCHPRVNVHKPGPGVGGHCIAVDPWFIYESAPHLANLIHLSRITNDNMPKFVVDKVLSVIPSSPKTKIAIFGMAFKGNIDDIRESPAMEIIKLLEGKYDVNIYDPLVKDHVEGKKESISEATEGAAAAIFLTDHNDFLNITPQQLKQYMLGDVVFDTRNILKFNEWTDEGFKVYSLGRPMEQALMIGQAVAGVEV